jgi:hypothetical protein
MELCTKNRLADEIGADEKMTAVNPRSEVATPHPSEETVSKFRGSKVHTHC